MIEHKNVYVALCAAQMAMEPLIKGAINPAFKGEGKPKGTTYADLSDVVSAVRPALVDNGLAYFHQIIRVDGNLDMRTSLVHGASDTRIDCDVPLIVAKNDMQGMKSATTYAKRIGLESVTGVAPEDDDGNAAAKAPPLIERFKPDLLVSRIAGADSGMALFAVLNDAPQEARDHPEVKVATTAKLRVLVMAAPSVAVLGKLETTFTPDWPSVKDAAEARKAELTEAPFL